MDNEQIKQAVNRFLAWKLPAGFNPDGGISFSASQTGSMPTGTNLFTATQAEAMLRNAETSQAAHHRQKKEGKAMTALYPDMHVNELPLTRVVKESLPCGGLVYFGDFCDMSIQQLKSNTNLTALQLAQVAALCAQYQEQKRVTTYLGRLVHAIHAKEVNNPAGDAALEFAAGFIKHGMHREEWDVTMAVFERQKAASVGRGVVN